MEDIKKLGIWMCHSSVHLMEYTNEVPDALRNNEQEEIHNVQVNDAAMQNEAFHLQTESFKKLGVAIERYAEILLFGPVDAKVEFMKFLNGDTRFEHIKIGIRQTNEMSENQQQNFVENYFSNH